MKGTDQDPLSPNRLAADAVFPQARLTRSSDLLHISWLGRSGSHHDAHSGVDGGSAKYL